VAVIAPELRILETEAVAGLREEKLDVSATSPVELRLIVSIAVSVEVLVIRSVDVDKVDEKLVKVMLDTGAVDEVLVVIVVDVDTGVEATEWEKVPVLTDER